MNYWLVKSEPDDYSIYDLERDKVSPWTGVRNYQARNFMRDGMKLGDQVFFYHSSITPPEIVGLATVSSLPYPDPTQFDSKSQYFDPKSSPENPTWMLVDITHKQTFPRSLSLDDIKKDPLLQSMRVAQKGSRLSVQPVEEVHAKTILKLLV